MSSQIPLPFGNFDRFNFDIFIPGDNKQIVDNLKSVISSGSCNFLYIWGNSGTGKSHLLQASCGYASSYKRKPVFLPLSEYQQLEPDVFSGLESLDLVCIDDLDCISGNPEWERGLFNLFNNLIENNKSLVVTSARSPSGNAIQLPDLKSRLASGVTYHLKYLGEDERMFALKQRANIRGFELSNEVLDYLARHVGRDMHTLFDWLERMDEATLVSKKKITVSLIKDMLGEKT